MCRGTSALPLCDVHNPKKNPAEVQRVTKAGMLFYLYSLVRSKPTHTHDNAHVIFFTWIHWIHHSYVLATRLTYISSLDLLTRLTIFVLFKAAWFALSDWVILWRQWITRWLCRVRLVTCHSSMLISPRDTTLVWLRSLTLKYAFWCVCAGVCLCVHLMCMCWSVFVHVRLCCV